MYSLSWVLLISTGCSSPTTLTLSFLSLTLPARMYHGIVEYSDQTLISYETLVVTSLILFISIQEPIGLPSYFRFMFLLYILT